MPIAETESPAKPEENIVIGNTTFLPTDTGYYAARIAAHVLGGGSDSRLFMILREQKGWTYGSYASLRRTRAGSVTMDITFLLVSSAVSER